MARFAVYKNLDGAGYLLDIQDDLLSQLNTRVVVPLLPLEIAPKPAVTLNPVFEIEGGSVAMGTQFMAAVPVQILKNPILSLESRRNDITAAVDLLFQGF
jgi:toxin CcdB